MSNHTPGPWEKCQNLVFDKNDTLVANASRRQDGYVQANARLIAAAPELLELCEEFLEWGRWNTNPMQKNVPCELFVKACKIISDVRGDEDVSQ